MCIVISRQNLLSAFRSDLDQEGVVFRSVDTAGDRLDFKFTDILDSARAFRQRGFVF